MYHIILLYSYFGTMSLVLQGVSSYIMYGTLRLCTHTHDKVPTHYALLYMTTLHDYMTT